MSHGGPPAWLDELVLESGPPWLHMGLRTIEEAAWLDVDDRRAAELAEKTRLLTTRHDDVFAALPGTEAAGEEVLALVATWLARHHPEATGSSEPPAGDGRHPLEVAATLVQEDLCVMAEHEGDVALVAAALCFPSHWRLADKIGGSAAAIHGPVPHYERELQAKVDRFLGRIPEGRIVLRRNWGVHDHQMLFVPEHPAPRPGITAENAGQQLWLRSERQTLRRLPATGAVLFTIRVQLAPLGVFAERPDLAVALAAAARAGATADRDRIPGGHLDAACRWLEAQAR